MMRKFAATLRALWVLLLTLFTFTAFLALLFFLSHIPSVKASEQLSSVDTTNHPITPLYMVDVVATFDGRALIACVVIYVG